MKNLLHGTNMLLSTFIAVSLLGLVLFTGCSSSGDGNGCLAALPIEGLIAIVAIIYVSQPFFREEGPIREKLGNYGVFLSIIASYVFNFVLIIVRSEGGLDLKLYITLVFCTFLYYMFMFGAFHFISQSIFLRNHAFVTVLLTSSILVVSTMLLYI